MSNKVSEAGVSIGEIVIGHGTWDLAYRFGISQSTVTYAVVDIIHIMFIKLQGLIH